MARRKITIEQVREFIETKYPGSALLSDSYVDNRSKLQIMCGQGHFFELDFDHLKNNGIWCDACGRIQRNKTCLERYGHENPTRNKEIRKKTEQTNLMRYGCKNPTQNYNIAIKQAKSSNFCVIKAHWKTGAEIACIAGYEQKTVDYLNKNKIDFLWQCEILKLSTGRTYRPDLYLPDRDLWVEIKGFFRGIALEKWTEFHEQIRPNSELWDRKKLKEMGIL